MTPDTQKRVYIIDSSSLINLNRFDSEIFEIPEHVWKRLDEMLEEGTIISSRVVYEEIVTDSQRPDKVSAWLKPKKSHFLKATNQQVLYMAEAVNKFSGLVDANSEKEQADPWLVALAREKTEQDTETEFVVVTQENKNSPIKIPAACKHYGIRCINSKEFFAEVGIVLTGS